MLGIVMCGGQSTRMQSDKGLLQNNNGNWARAAYEKLLAVCSRVLVSVNSSQLAYRQYFAVEELLPDDESLNVHGPLRGVLSAHLINPCEDLLILACDMPDMAIQPLQHLLLDFEQHPGAEALFYIQPGGEPEPLCAIYTAKGLYKISSIYKSGGLKKFSMKYALEQMETHPIVLPENWMLFFKNINTQTDLNSL